MNIRTRGAQATWKIRCNAKKARPILGIDAENAGLKGAKFPS